MSWDLMDFWKREENEKERLKIGTPIPKKLLKGLIKCPDCSDYGNFYKGQFFHEFTKKEYKTGIHQPIPKHIKSGPCGSCDCPKCKTKPL